MDIVISNLDMVPYHVRNDGITHVLSLLRGREFNGLRMPEGVPVAGHLRLDMDDVIDQDAPMAPTRGQVEEILDWGKGLPSDARVLVHCYAGVSRSTASALALMVQDMGIDRVGEAVARLVDIRPIACPNPLITMHADDILGCGGELHSSAEVVASRRLFKLYGGDPMERSHMGQ